MVAAAIEWARARGLHKLTLSVFPHNDAAIALYRKFGFAKEGRRSPHTMRVDVKDAGRRVSRLARHSVHSALGPPAAKVSLLEHVTVPCEYDVRAY